MSFAQTPTRLKVRKRQKARSNSKHISWRAGLSWLEPEPQCVQTLGMLERLQEHGQECFNSGNALRFAHNSWVEVQADPLQV